jgi:cytochrome c-type biogenesis protein CcmH/NrfG
MPNSMFQQLTELRMNDIDWQTLGECRALNNNSEGAILAFKKALAIRSDRPELHALLAETYARKGRPDLAMKHRQQAERLARLNSLR